MFELNKFLQCTVCRELKNNPRETQCCHKLYCQDCIQNMTPNICPTCRQRTSFVENPLVSKFISNKLGDDSMTDFSTSFLQLCINPNLGKNESDANDKAFKVTVLTLEERRINVYVEPSDTVKILKLKVQRKDGMLFFFMTRKKRSCILIIIFSLGIAPEHQRLIFQGKQLEDHNAISDYKIGKDNTIHLVNRFNSG